MIKWTIFLLPVIALFACDSKTSFPDKGVSWDLAESRHVSLTNVTYDLHFSIPENQKGDIRALCIITFNQNTNKDVYLDFKEEHDHLTLLKVNGEPLEFQFDNEHIRIPKRYLDVENRVEIAFIAGNLSLNRNEEYLYTLLVPDRARTVFPVFDQPNIKATFKLSLQIPKHWEAIANGPLESMEEDKDVKTLKYRETKPISTYLFAFAAGKFQKIANDEGNMTMYFRESDEKKVERNVTQIFQLHADALEWLEQYTGISYPFQKFDFALIPTFQYGGMEHPGSIFYRESSLMLDESPSVNRQLSRASLIAHETAHMWFGDLVTMNWFDDVWLKEVFANFYAAKIVNPSFPDVNHELRFLLAHYPRAYRIDRSEGSHPIQQSLDNLENAGSLYGPIIYQKAPIVMRQLESILGQDAFQKAIREYLETNSYGNATWDQLIDIMNNYTDQELQKWNHDWVKTAGMPQIQITKQDRVYTYTLLNGQNGLAWPQRIHSKVGGMDFELIFPNEENHGVAEGQFIPNVDGRTYGYLDLTTSMLSDITLDFKLQEEIARASVWMTLWESFLQGKLEVESYFSLLLDALETEYNSLIINYLNSNIGSLFWSFMSEKERVDISEKLEELIFDKLMRTADMSVKRNLYNLYTSIATSNEAISKLRHIWSDELYGFTLPLSENNKIRLAYQLALRDAEDSKEILETQYLMVENEDNKARMKFLIPFLSSDKAQRDSVFQSLLNAENREKEPWVSEGLSYLHHPLRAKSALHFILPSLEIIEEIKSTGDIFFPAAWLGAILGGHSSPVALEIVESFLDTQKDLPSDLRNKILQASDILKRAVLHSKDL